MERKGNEKIPKPLSKRQREFWAGEARLCKAQRNSYFLYRDSDTKDSKITEVVQHKQG